MSRSWPPGRQSMRGNASPLSGSTGRTERRLEQRLDLVGRVRVAGLEQQRRAARRVGRRHAGAREHGVTAVEIGRVDELAGREHVQDRRRVREGAHRVERAHAADRHHVVEAGGQADPVRLRLVAGRREGDHAVGAQRVDRPAATGSTPSQSLAEKKDDRAEAHVHHAHAELRVREDEVERGDPVGRGDPARVPDLHRDDVRPTVRLPDRRSRRRSR